MEKNYNPSISQQRRPDGQYANEYGDEEEDGYIEPEDDDTLERDFDDGSIVDKYKLGSNNAQPPLTKTGQHMKSANHPGQQPLGAASNIGDPSTLTASENEQHVFNVSLKQTLPRPQDISDLEKKFLLPKIEAQNDKLRKQVTGLMEMLEAYAMKLYFKKTEKYQPQKYVPDEHLQEKDGVLREKIVQIKHYRLEIAELRKQLQQSYNIERLVQLESEIKLKQQRVVDLQIEAEVLKKVETEQQLAFQAVNRDGDYDEKIQEMGAEARKLKKQWRQMNQESVAKDKELIEKHDEVVKLERRVRMMTLKVKEEIKQPTIEPLVTTDNVTEGQLQSLEEQIQLIKSQKKRELKDQKLQLQEQQEEIEELSHETKLLEVRLREREQEAKLAELKVKELTRNIRFKGLKPIFKLNSKDGDVDYKRNNKQYQSMSEMPGSKVLKKKLENGRVTYQDVVLTEENVKLHERKYEASPKSNESPQELFITRQADDIKQQYQTVASPQQPPKNMWQQEETPVPAQQLSTMNSSPLQKQSNQNVSGQQKATIIKPIQLGQRQTIQAVNDQGLNYTNAENNISFGQGPENQPSQRESARVPAVGGTGVYSKPNIIMQKKKVS